MGAMVQLSPRTMRWLKEAQRKEGMHFDQLIRVLALAYADVPLVAAAAYDTMISRDPDCGPGYLLEQTPRPRQRSSTANVMPGFRALRISNQTKRLLDHLLEHDQTAVVHDDIVAAIMLKSVGLGPECAEMYDRMLQRNASLWDERDDLPDCED